MASLRLCGLSSAIKVHHAIGFLQGVMQMQKKESSCMTDAAAIWDVWIKLLTFSLFMTGADRWNGAA